MQAIRDCYRGGGTVWIALPAVPWPLPGSGTLPEPVVVGAGRVVLDAVPVVVFLLIMNATPTMRIAPRMPPRSQIP